MKYKENPNYKFWAFEMEFNLILTQIIKLINAKT